MRQYYAVGDPAGRDESDQPEYDHEDDEIEARLRVRERKIERDNGKW